MYVLGTGLHGPILPVQDIYTHIFFPVLGIEYRILGIPDKNCNAELHSNKHFVTSINNANQDIVTYFLQVICR